MEWIYWIFIYSIVVKIIYSKNIINKNIIRLSNNKNIQNCRECNDKNFRDAKNTSASKQVLFYERRRCESILHLSHSCKMYDSRFPSGGILQTLYSTGHRKNITREDTSTIYLVTVYGSALGDIDKSALSGLFISINHYNDPRALPTRIQISNSASNSSCSPFGYLLEPHGSRVIIKLLSSLRKVSDTQFAFPSAIRSLVLSTLSSCS